MYLLSDAGQRLGLVQALLYQTELLMATGDLRLKPLLHGVDQIHSPSTEVNPGQAAIAFEILDDIPVILCVGDFRDTEKPDHFLFGHNAGTRDKSTVWAW